MIVFAIRCDGDGCLTEDEPPGEAQTFTQARAKLHRLGWHLTKKGRDLCPPCWEAGKR